MAIMTLGLHTKERGARARQRNGLATKRWCRSTCNDQSIDQRTSIRRCAGQLRMKDLWSLSHLSSDLITIYGYFTDHEMGAFGPPLLRLLLFVVSSCLNRRPFFVRGKALISNWINPKLIVIQSPARQDAWLRGRSGPTVTREEEECPRDNTRRVSRKRINLSRVEEEEEVEGENWPDLQLNEQMLLVKNGLQPREEEGGGGGGGGP